jgi:hypothetical protein
MGRLTAGARNKRQRLVESGRIRSGVTVVVVNRIFTDTLWSWTATTCFQYRLKMLHLQTCFARRTGLGRPWQR